MNIPPEEDRFHTNSYDLGRLIGYHIEQTQNKGYNVINPQLYNIALEYLRSYDHTNLINNFVEREQIMIEGKRYSTWDLIHSRDESLFFKHPEVIFGLSAETLKPFADLLALKDSTGALVIGSDVRDSIWRYLTSNVKICIKYVHRQRQPLSKVVQGVAQYSYGNNIFPHIDLTYHAKKWGVKLDFPPLI